MNAKAATGNSSDSASGESEEVSALKSDAIALVDEMSEILIDVSHQIWEHPELGFQEQFAHDLLCDVIDSAGLKATRQAYGLETAFEASAGSEGIEVGIMCEYDALPGLGHACGHNIIATTGLGAGLAAAAIAERGGGRVRILGTPAEEGGGGKVLMAREGALEGLDAAIMVHPADRNLPTMSSVAIHRLNVTYTGKESHSAAAPDVGRNALDAAVLGYMNVAALRQHIRAEESIHGVFTDGGDKPNIVPAHAATHWYVRAADADRLEALRARVLDALSAGALATGCSMQHEWLDPPYADMVDDPMILAAYERNAAALGRVSEDPLVDGPVIGSTDMGNVSHEVPSIHPMIAVAPRGTSIHTEEFAVCARSEAGDRAVIDGAKALACTIVDLWSSPS